jgi:hypothetical protein
METNTLKIIKKRIIEEHNERLSLLSQSRDLFLIYFYKNINDKSREENMTKIRRESVITFIHDDTQLTALQWIEIDKCKVDWKDSIFLSRNNNDTIAQALRKKYDQLYHILYPDIPLQDGFIKVKVRYTTIRLYLTKKNEQIQLSWRIKNKNKL